MEGPWKLSNWIPVIISGTILNHWVIARAILSGISEDIVGGIVRNNFERFVGGVFICISEGISETMHVEYSSGAHSGIYVDILGWIPWVHPR